MIQENGTDTGDRYEYRKIVSIQKTGTNTENNIDTGNRYEYRKTI